MKRVITLIAIACTGLLLSGVVFAQSPRGCSEIEGLDATTIDGNLNFEGQISGQSVGCAHHRGKASGGPDNGDSDAFSDSLESCINDALFGHVTTLLGDNDGCFTLVADCTARRGNIKQFAVNFAGSCSAGLDGTNACQQDSDCDTAPQEGDGVCDHSTLSDDCNVGVTECSDRVDNTDLDTVADVANDPGCADYDDNDETSQCEDGINNDGDGDIDWPADLQCTSFADNDESA